MINILKKINTVVTIVGTVYTVSKFMYDTFKKYEEKHGKKENSNRSNRKRTGKRVQKGHENTKKVSKRKQCLR